MQTWRTSAPHLGVGDTYKETRDHLEEAEHLFSASRAQLGLASSLG